MEKRTDAPKDAPKRPPNVPTGAVFNAHTELWEHTQRNDLGELHGLQQTFAEGGTLVSRGAYQSGKPHGSFSRFSDGTFGGVALRACCVPPGARELRERYRDGYLINQIFFDERGTPLCEDGTPWPERHPKIPEEAEYQPRTARFSLQELAADGKIKLSHFAIDGALLEEEDLLRGRARARRRFAPDGTCVASTPLDEHGAPHGFCTERFVAGESPYADARVAELTGEREHGEPVGTWSYRDASGALIRQVELGARLGAQTPLVLGTEPPEPVSAEALWIRASELHAGEAREAFALAARALGRDRDVARFERFRDEHSVPLRTELGRLAAEATAVANGASVSSVLGAALGGADPAILLRGLSSMLRGHAPAALDYFEASLAWCPEQEMVPLAHGLLCIEHGEPERALEAAARVAEPASAAQSLRDFCRVTYGAFAFGPERDGVMTVDEELVEVASAQSLEAVRDVMGLYATRLGLVRNELARRVRREPAWLPPDPAALLPDGPRELRRFTATIEDEGENGPERSLVEVDETLSLTGSSRELLTVARSDWAALGWLAWSAGLDAVALPERLTPRPEFAAAAHQATLRCWRAHDRQRSQGLIAMSRHVPGFSWEGFAIDDVPAHLVEVVAAEYLEIRAQFLWQLFPENVSPFQADLRRA